MNSIKKKLFFQIGSLAIILIGFMVLANTYLLQPYYINKEKKQLYTYYKKINNFSSTDYTDSLSDLISIEDASNIDILIYNSEGDIQYASKSYMKDKHLLEFLGSLPNKKGLKPPGPPVKINHEEPINDKVRYIWVDDLMSGGKSLVLTGQLDNDYNIDLRLPLMSIKKSISLSNRFLLFTGIPLFLIGIISAYFLSKSFTKPILQMNKATNSMKQLDFSTKCTVLSNDEIGQLASSINDMSIELEKTIKSLNTSNINLQQEIAEKTKIDERRKQLLNNVSHELKTPLSLMQGYAEGLKLNVAQKHNRTDFYCDVIVDEVKKMNQLVQNLLNINQIEFGDTTPNNTTFEIVEFIEYILKKYDHIFSEKNINLQFNPIEPISVYADILKAEQVLTNYLNNAIQYVDNHKDIRVTLLTKDNHVRIEIYNSCETIDADELDKLWLSFYKRDKARTRQPGSHGLGLSIVKAIQEASNNDYGVRTTTNGITFWFELDIKGRE